MSIKVFGEVELPLYEIIGESIFDQHIEKPTMTELKQAYVDLTTKGKMDNDNVFKAICLITKPCTK